MFHLQVFLSNGTKNIVSTKQLRFFLWQLDKAEKTHKTLGLPVVDAMSTDSCIATTFFLDSDTNGSNYIAIEIIKDGQRRLQVNFGEAAAKNLGYEWKNEWVKV